MPNVCDIGLGFGCLLAFSTSFQDEIFIWFRGFISRHKSYVRMSISTKERDGHFIHSLTLSRTHLGLTSAQPSSHAALLQAKERKTEKRHKPNQNHPALPTTR
jgi:hypothetical protein